MAIFNSRDRATIIAVGGTKGGSGKSTIATNLAVEYATTGHRVLLVDADDQRTAVDFSCLRAQTHPTAPSYTCVPLAGQAVFTETQKLAANYDTIVIDTGGRDTASQRAAILVADLYLVPVVPRSFDVWTLDTVATLLREESWLHNFGR